MKKKQIGLIFGGRSGEHEVSLSSAANIARGFDPDKYEVFPVLISREGRWYGPVPMEEIALADQKDYSDREILLASYPGGVILSAADGSEVARLDGVFPIVHGNTGEDGILQGLLELADIPYVGPGVTASALCMDKVMMKKVLQYHNIPMVEFTYVTRKQLEQDEAAVIAKLESVLAYPMFVKPSNGGSSVGAGKAHNREELADILRSASRFDTKILVERAVNAREIEVAVLGNDSPLVSMPGEIVSCHEFYDYEAKYLSEGSVCNIPADITPEQIDAIRTTALEVYRALECEGMSRVDFFIDRESGSIYLNEINSLPGFTDISMYPKMCEAMGYPLAVLLDELIRYGEERHRERTRNAITM